MTVVTNTWRQLVRRRLWPVALLLLAALAAVPFVLASEPAPVEPPADPLVAVSTDDELAEPVVAKVAAEERTRRRRVLGVRKDPFKPAPVKKPKKAKSAAKPAKSSGSSSEPKPSTSVSTPSPAPSTGGGSFVDPSPSTTPAPKPKAPPAGSIVVRFGDATSDELPRGLLKKLEPLPDDEEPLLVYMGLTKNKKKAIFLVDAALTPTGDGTCKPHPSSCETVELAQGETEFFDVLDPEADEPTAQYQLDVVRINK